MNVGIDIVEISRIAKLIARYQERFLDKVFTTAEQNYCKNYTDYSTHYAGRFAAKEAIRKALQPFTELTYLPFRDMEILPDRYGMPVVHLLRELPSKKSFQGITLSISHERNYAIACAIITS